MKSTFQNGINFSSFCFSTIYWIEESILLKYIASRRNAFKLI